MDEKLKKIIYIVLGSFILLFFILFLISSCSNKTTTPETLEKRIVENSKSYFKSHKDELPSKNGTLTLSLSDLTSKGIIDEVTKLIDKNTTCSGSLTIENNNNYYMYSPSLECTGNNEYKTNKLYDVLLENIVNSGNGLYSIGSNYYFRGDSVDNYIVFDGSLFRILGINNDHTIRLIEDGRRDPVSWDDRYSNEVSSSTGINDYVVNNIGSRIKDSLDEIYKNNTVLSNNAKGFIKETSLCIGKRSEEDTDNSGAIECSKTLDNQYLGLIQLNEYLIASLDPNCNKAIDTSCSNYNYLADFKNSYWTITADSANTNHVFKIYDTANSTLAANVGMNRMVINISDNTSVTGEGTEDNPYVITGLKNIETK